MLSRNDSEHDSVTYDEDGLPIVTYPFKDMLDGAMRAYSACACPNDPPFTKEEFLKRQHLMLFDMADGIGRVLRTLGATDDDNLAVYLRAVVSSAVNSAKQDVESGRMETVVDYVMNHYDDVKH